MSEKPVRVIRTPHSKDRPYFSMSRSAAQDERLTWEARGILAYLLSKPDDWEVRARDLQQNCGRDKVYKLLKELEANGYLSRKLRHHAKTKLFVGVDYFVHEQPLPENPDTAVPDAALPDTAKPELTEDRESQSKDSHIKIESTTPDGENHSPSGKKERKPNPNAPLRDALIAAFGYAPESVTKSADGLFWATAAELARVHVTAGQIPALYAYVKSRAAREQWKSFSARALAKYAPDWLKQQPPAPVNPAAPPVDPNWEPPEFTFEEMQARAKRFLGSAVDDDE